jgi:hypothetical protein
MEDVLSPLLCDPEWIGVRRQVEAVLNAAPRRERRGDPLAHCKDCRKPIWRPEYARRAQGEKCGGRIGHPRVPAAPRGPARRPVEGDDQMALFEICVVRVKA